MVPDSAHLVNEDRLTETLEKLDDGLRILRFIQELKCYEGAMQTMSTVRVSLTLRNYRQHWPSSRCPSVWLTME